MSSEATLRELRKISRILILANAASVEKELSKIATTNDRKKMWVLMDGKRMPGDIAKEAGVTAMTVSYFLNAGVAAELVEYKRGEPPRRILDYVPPAWIELVKLPVSGEAEVAQQVKLDTTIEEQKEKTGVPQVEEVSVEGQTKQTGDEQGAGTK
jgi:hypothetical protein